MIFIVSSLIACSGGEVEEKPTEPVVEQPAQEAAPVAEEAPAQPEAASVTPATEPAASTTTTAQ